MPPVARIFFALALFAVSLLVLNAVLGFFGGDYNATMRRLQESARQMEAVTRAPGSSAEEREAARERLEELVRQSRPARNWTTAHRLLGVAAALVTVLVNSITVTYFIGTARWCREVVETYQLDPELAERSDRLKRRSFPWSAIGILIVIGLVALGALSDPGANVRQSEQWVMPHYLLAIIGILVIGYAFLRQVVAIGANYEVIEQILNDVQRIRSDRGLETAVRGQGLGDGALEE